MGSPTVHDVDDAQIEFSEELTFCDFVQWHLSDIAATTLLLPICEPPLQCLQL